MLTVWAPLNDDLGSGFAACALAGFLARGVVMVLAGGFTAVARNLHLWLSGNATGRPSGRVIEPSRFRCFRGAPMLSFDMTRASDLDKASDSSTAGAALRILAGATFVLLEDSAAGVSGPVLLFIARVDRVFRAHSNSVVSASRVLPRGVYLCCQRLSSYVSNTALTISE